MEGRVHYLNSRYSLRSASRLLGAIEPRASSFHLYGDSGDFAWSSCGEQDAEIDEFVGEASHALSGPRKNQQHIRRTARSGRTLIALPVVTAGSDANALLVTVFPKNVGHSSSFDSLAFSREMAPMLDVLADIVQLGDDLSAANTGLERLEQEISLVYSIDRKLHDSSRRHSGLADLVGLSGRFLGVAYSVLLLPGKRIRISATHSSWRAVNRRAVDKYVVETLLPTLEGATAPVVCEISSIDGSEQPVDQGCFALLCPLVDGNDNVEGVLAQFSVSPAQTFDERHKQFMTHIVRKVEDVIERSFDRMTGLMNRAGFETQLREARQKLVGTKNSHAVVYFDLDNLQLVNDTFGQQAGDQVIKRFALLLESQLPRNAVATRLTADDFAVLISGGSLDDALALANEVRARGDQLRYLQGSQSLQVTASIGIAELFGGDDALEALVAARIACDMAKDRGRDRIEVHDTSDRSMVRRYDDMQFVTRIQQTLDNDEFLLMAQPIVQAQDPSKVARYEVLIRTRDGDGNLVSPGALISAAERYNLMPQIDRWVTSSTIRAIAAQAERLEELGISFAINLSGQSIGDDEMRRFIEDELDSSNIPPSLVSFEITESAAVSNLVRAQRFIDELRNRGCRFALDDFGAGLSSFAYLKNLAVDTLKIDGNFVRDITRDRISQSMVAAITQVAGVMELKTVAEYVGDSATQKLLESLGVDLLQGHGVGRPEKLRDVISALTGVRKTA